MSLYILSLLEAKSELAIPDAKDDGVLTRWMEGLQGRFEDHLQRQLLRASNVEQIFDGGDNYILVNRWPIESVSSIHVDPTQGWSAATLLASDEYIINKPRGRIRMVGEEMAWPNGEQNVRVVYTGGFVGAGTAAAAGQTAMPEAIRRAFAMQLGFEWRNRTQLGRESISAQGQTVQIAPAELLREVRETLQPYRRILMG